MRTERGSGAISGGVRDSNMELLRIVAMSMILCHHFLLHGLHGKSWPSLAFYYVDVFILDGVNLFFMVSGFYLIRCSLRRVARFVVMVWFFVAVNLLLLAMAGHPVGARGVVKCLVYPLSEGGYWFVQEYFLLMLLAPVINAGLTKINGRDLNRCIVLFSFFLVVMRMHFADMNFLNAFYMYSLGFWVRRTNMAARFGKGLLLAVFLGCCLCLDLWQWHYIYHRGAIWNEGRCYDSPLVVLSSIALFLFFAKLRFRSRWVNSVAEASFGCYLLQDGKFGFGFFYDAFLYRFAVCHGFGLSVVLLLSGCFLAFWMASWLLTKFLRLWDGRVADAVVRGVKMIVPRRFLHIPGGL